MNEFNFEEDIKLKKKHNIYIELMKLVVILLCTGKNQARNEQY